MQIDHVQLAAPPGCETKARRFFGSLLGVRELEKPEPLGSRGGGWFQSGSAIVHVGVETDFRAQRKAHPAFVVDDLESLARQLRSHGCDVLWDEALPDRKRF